MASLVLAVSLGAACTTTNDAEPPITSLPALAEALPGSVTAAGPFAGHADRLADEPRLAVLWVSPATGEFLEVNADGTHKDPVDDLYRLEGTLTGATPFHSVEVEGGGPTYAWRATAEAEGWVYRGTSAEHPIGIWSLDMFHFDTKADASEWYDGYAPPALEDTQTIPLDVRSLGTRTKAFALRFPVDSVGSASRDDGFLIRVLDDTATVVDVFLRISDSRLNRGQLLDEGLQIAREAVEVARRVADGP